jgi:3-isopropylmalate dehydrogenase
VTAQSIRLAVIGGDGIGPEVVAEAIKVLSVLDTIAIEPTDYDLGSRRWNSTGEVLPDSVLGEIAQHDAILLGAVGDPSVPSGILERGLLLRLRFEFDQYVNLRPVRLYPGVASPLGFRSEQVDMLVVREGTEGPYIEAGGFMRKGTPAEVATQESINTAFGISRVARYALQRAAERPRRRLTLVHKANVLAYAGDLWRRTVTQLGADYPSVTTEYCHMDSAVVYFLTQPERFDVILTDNMFGDILTSLGAAVAGGIGLAASANINPERTAPSMFEPVHGSAPDIAGKHKADPTATILSAAMLCEHLGLSAEAVRIEQAVSEDLLERQGAWSPRSTPEIGDDIAERVAG